MLLKLGRRVEGGVGPDGDIVAFTTLCPHNVDVAADKTLTIAATIPGSTVKRAVRRSSAMRRKTYRSSDEASDSGGDIHAVAVDGAPTDGRLRAS